MKLAVVEILDRDGHARTAVPVWQWPVTVGRSVTCDVVIDDPHAAPLHATLIDADGVLTLMAGDTINGVRIGTRRLAPQDRAAVEVGESFVVGATSVRVRRASDPLPAERRLTSSRAAGRLQTALVVAAFTLWSMAEYWLNTDPGQPSTEGLFVVLAALLVLITWSGIWSVGSKLVQHRFDFSQHLLTAASYALVSSAVLLLLPLASYASGWTMFSRVSSIVAAGVGWSMVLAHLRLVWPGRVRVLTAVMAVIFAAGLIVHVTSTYQTNDRLSSELYVTMLGPPAIRLAPAVDAARFIDEARALEAVLTHHAAEDADVTPSSPRPSVP